MPHTQVLQNSHCRHHLSYFQKSLELAHLTGQSADSSLSTALGLLLLSPRVMLAVCNLGKLLSWKKKKCAGALAIREMHMKTTMCFHLISVRMVIVWKSKIYKCWWGFRIKVPYSIVGGNINWYNHYGRWNSDSSKYENRFTTWLSHLTPRNVLKWHDIST